MLDKIKTWVMSLNNIQKVAVLVIVALLIAYFPYFAGGWDSTGSMWDGDLKAVRVEAKNGLWLALMAFALVSLLFFKDKTDEEEE